MIEARVPGEVDNTQDSGITPKQISTTQILADLENGIDRKGIQEKYNLETWMVAEIFKHPKLKGKKAKKVRKLPFEFIDDTETVDPNQTSIPVETEYKTTEATGDDHVVDSFDGDDDDFEY